MSYTPNTWQDGDTITAAKLNNMESGIENANTPFVVNLTPENPDFSGTMDKTVAEINTAYEAGQRILYRVWTGEDEYTEADVTMVYKNPSFTYPSFNAFIIDDANNLLIEALTLPVDAGTQDFYSTSIYPLTPMNG